MVQTYIPISNIVNVTNSVVQTATTGFIPQLLLLTKNNILPTGTILPFTSQAAVGAYFGTASGEFSEYTNAGFYFASYVGTTTLPSSILIARYTDTATTPWTRGAALLSADLAGLIAISTGTLNVVFGGTTVNVVGIDLTADTSFSDIAATIQTALQVSSLGSQAYCTFDTTTNAFTIGHNVSAQSVGYITSASDNLATLMKITQASGAILSQGTPVMTPQENMDAIVAQNGNFVPYTYNFDVSGDTNYSTIMGLTAWAAAQNNNYAFMAWSKDTNIVAAPQSTNTAPYYVATNGYGSVAPTGQITFNAPIAFYYSDIDFIMGQAGTIAGVNYNNSNATINLANKTYAGIVPLCSNQTQYNQALLNGCNFYGTFASRANVFNLSIKGTLGGIFLWIDNLVNQAWLNDAVTTAEVNYLNQVLKLGYNNTTSLKGIILDIMNQGLTNGVIAAGNTFSAEQTAILKQQAGGIDITPNLTNNGYFVQIVPPTPAQRQQRILGLVKIWYSNGQAINTINNQLTLVI
jgi:Protein of unknown function (DUF3383)